LKAEQLKFPLNESDITVHQTTTQLVQQTQKVHFVILRHSQCYILLLICSRDTCLQLL